AVAFTRRERWRRDAPLHLARIVVVGLITVLRFAGRGVFLSTVVTIGCTTFDVAYGCQFANLRLRQEIKDDQERVLVAVSAEHERRLCFAPVEVSLDAAEQNLCRFEEAHAGKHLAWALEVDGDGCSRVRHHGCSFCAVAACWLRRD